MVTTPLNPEPWHGSVSGYTYHGCRCDVCRAGWSAANLRSRQLRATRRVPDHLHGTENGYNNYKCRCDACRAAWAERARRYRAMKRQQRDSS
jgi:hypothetical protein